MSAPFEKPPKAAQKEAIASIIKEHLEPPNPNQPGPSGEGQLRIDESGSTGNQSKS